MSDYDGSKTQVSYGEERTELIDLDVHYGGGAVIANYTITTMAGMTVGKYNGQRCFVQYRGGAVDGKVYHIVSNTATVITFQEDIQTAGMADTDEIAIESRGQLAADTTEFFGDLEESDLPHPKLTEKEHFIKGHANEPERKNASITKMEFEASMPLQLLNGKLLFYGLGYCADVASNFGALATTSTRAIMIGELNITEAIATASGFLANDYIQIGNAAEGEEIRKISSVTANVPVGFDTLNLDLPVRRFHPNGCVIKECDITTAKPVTHTLRPWTNAPSLTLEAVWRAYDRNHAANDIVMHFTGIHCNGLGLKSSDETLSLDWDILAMNALTAQRAKASVVATDWAQREFLYSDSTVTINGAIFSKIEDLDYGTKRNLKSKRYHNQNTDVRPGDMAFDGFEHECKISLPFDSLTFWNLVKAKTKFDSNIKYERDATDDYMTIYINESYARNCPPNFPEKGEIIHDLELTPGRFYIEVVDTIEYY